MYKLLKDSFSNKIRTDYLLYLNEDTLDTKAFIPFDAANTDYQEYLKWVAEGNTPEPADE